MQIEGIEVEKSCSGYCGFFFTPALKSTKNHSLSKSSNTLGAIYTSDFKPFLRRKFFNLTFDFFSRSLM